MLYIFSILKYINLIYYIYFKELLGTKFVINVLADCSPVPNAINCRVDLETKLPEAYAGGAGLLSINARCPKNISVTNRHPEMPFFQKQQLRKIKGIQASAKDAFFA